MSPDTHAEATTHDKDKHGKKHKKADDKTAHKDKDKKQQN